MRYITTVGESVFEIEVGTDGVTVDGEKVDASLARVPGTEVLTVLLDASSHRIVARGPQKGVWDLLLNGKNVRVEVVDERTRAIRQMLANSSATHGPRPLLAPMPGLVIRVEVAEGDMVEPGQGLLIVEAMKMENELKAEVRGRVKVIHCEPGGIVNKGDVLVDFHPPEGTE